MKPEAPTPPTGQRRRHRRRKRRSANKRFGHYILLSAVIGAVSVATFIFMLNRPAASVSAKSKSLEEILQRH